MDSQCEFYASLGLASVAITDEHYRTQCYSLHWTNTCTHTHPHTCTHTHTLTCAHTHTHTHTHKRLCIHSFAHSHTLAFHLHFSFLTLRSVPIYNSYGNSQWRLTRACIHSTTFFLFTI